MGQSSRQGMGSGQGPGDDALVVQLEVAEARLRIVLGLTDGVVFEFDAEGRYVGIWTQSDLLLTLPREQALGRTLMEVHGPQVGAFFMERLRQTLETGQPLRFEYSLEVAGGHRWFSAESMRVPHRTTVAFLVRDITQHKAMEQRLIQADRLAALGTLAAGVAHEVNNPLSYVSSNLNFISENLTAVKRAMSGVDGPLDVTFVERLLGECAEALAEAREGTTRIRHVVGDLKTFAQVETEEGLADVKRALESSLSLVTPELRHRARINRHLEDVPPVRGNESRLGQVFLNLLINAAQAIDSGAPERNQVDVHLRGEGRWVVIEIQDTGHGIPPDLLKLIFDPFFSTRPVGIGTGLGLSICHGIVTALGGEISVESTVGRGTCFRVRLPVGDEDAVSAGTAPM
ncbi:sensor histidine kinase [Hyalangium gracile]|uniref:sensor histidine kinase n=1 Tax=Hyalangium gracile TaxID=394092 RepID=UPI001CC920F9|nr:ATP-binding protein [Hyalangium gracile]